MSTTEQITRSREFEQATTRLQALKADLSVLLDEKEKIVRQEDAAKELRDLTQHQPAYRNEHIDAVEALEHLRDLRSAVEKRIAVTKTLVEAAEARLNAFDVSEVELVNKIGRLSAQLPRR